MELTAESRIAPLGWLWGVRQGAKGYQLPVVDLMQYTTYNLRLYISDDRDFN